MNPGVAKRGWGVNVHWERCEPHMPCPPADLGASGGPRPGEAAQLGQAFGRARTGVRWFLVEQQVGVYNFSAYERMLAEQQAAVRQYEARAACVGTLRLEARALDKAGIPHIDFGDEIADDEFVDGVHALQTAQPHWSRLLLQRLGDL